MSELDRADESGPGPEGCGSKMITASPSSSASKCNAEIAPLLEVQEHFGQAFTKLNASDIENASKTSKKSEALIHILSVLQGFNSRLHLQLMVICPRSPPIFLSKMMVILSLTSSDV